ncbi:hypothetical protein [Paraburkholderia sp. J10-1]|uniref:hypothetical protein n=1 Tax=Paraburkholderia sp. J10-1 TaxID=2805430 RepID=UPI002AB6D911|nr:hypothetical protein [Paraburkholderia sp. J10-1]
MSVKIPICDGDQTGELPAWHLYTKLLVDVLYPVMVGGTGHYHRRGGGRHGMPPHGAGHIAVTKLVLPTSATEDALDCGVSSVTLAQWERALRLGPGQMLESAEGKADASDHG